MSIQRTVYGASFRYRDVLTFLLGASDFDLMLLISFWCCPFVVYHLILDLHSVLVLPAVSWPHAKLLAPSALLPVVLAGLSECTPSA